MKKLTLFLLLLLPTTTIFAQETPSKVISNFSLKKSESVGKRKKRSKVKPKSSITNINFAEYNFKSFTC